MNRELTDQASLRGRDVCFLCLHSVCDYAIIKVVSVKPGVISTPLWKKSVYENSGDEALKKGYEKEMEYLLKNAEDNEKTGLDVKEVVKVILKADNAKNPKLTYTVGKDALVARLAAKLPQSIINRLIRLGIRLRMK